MKRRRRTAGEVLSRPDLGDAWTLYGHVTPEEAAESIFVDMMERIELFEDDGPAYAAADLEVRHAFYRCQRFHEGASAEGFGFTHWVVEVEGEAKGPGVFPGTEVTTKPERRA